MTTKEQEAVNRIMKGLKCSEQEAKEIYATDCAIDRGEPTDFDLPKEKEKIAKKFAHTGTKKKPTVYQFNKRERKENPTKGGIIAELANFLEKNSEFATENVEIVNKERQIAFFVSGNKYELTLVQKRKPK